MGMGMAVSMAAMMVPTAAPFFLAYARDTRRPPAIATVVLLYVATWAAIGLALDYVMSQIVMPSSLLVVAIAVGFALVYAATPWGRWAREQCRQMSRRVRRGSTFRDAVAEGATYAACCVLCSAAVMLVLVVLGMSNPLVIMAGAVVMLCYKLIPWPASGPSAG
jgi:predicted metal-binding membrane protein